MYRITFAIAVTHVILEGVCYFKCCNFSDGVALIV